MSTPKKKNTVVKQSAPVDLVDYPTFLNGISELLESARRTAMRSVNAVMTAAYWEIGRRVVETDQGGDIRAEYGQQLIKRLSSDLKARFGRGFSPVNLSMMKRF